MTKPRRVKSDSPSPQGAPPLRLATKDCISNLLKTIEDQSKKISVLEDRIAVMESHISQLRIVYDNAKQYQRRLCLRIDGIDLPPVFKKLKLSL